MNDIPVPSPRLAELRAQLDALDDQLHDLFMQRAEIVKTVAAEGGKKGTKIRPGREAIILRRMLARHKGAWPAQAIIRIWEEIFVAALTIEGGQTLAISGGDGAETRLALAREYFGPLIPLRHHRNPAQTLNDLAPGGGAQLAILPPLGKDDELDGSWWTMLAETDPPMYIIMKLPFWAPRAEGSPIGEAYVAATIPPDASGADHGFLLLSFDDEVSRSRVFETVTASGFVVHALWLNRIQSGPHFLVLVEVEGLVSNIDPRLGHISGLSQAARVVGGYALPITEAPIT